MSVNRFDTPIGQRYVSTYVPLPFEELAYIAKQHQDKHDKNRAIVDELSTLGQAIKAAPMYEDHRQKFLGEINSSITNLVNSTDDYATPEFQRKALRLVNDFKSRPEINAFTNTLKSYQEWEKIRQNQDRQRDLDFTYDKDNTGSFRQRDVLNEGVYTPNFTKYAESAKATEEIMKGIATEGGGYGQWDLSSTKQMNDGYHYAVNKKSGKWERLTDDKLKAVAQVNLPNYARTDAGLYRIRELLNSPTADYDSLVHLKQTPEGKKVYDVVTNELYKDLYTTGYKQLFNKSSTDNDINVIADELGRDKIKEQDNSQPVYTSPANTVKGLGIANDFENTSGYKTSYPGIGGSEYFTGPGTNAPDKYKQLKEMDDKTKKFAEDVIKQVSPASYEAYKQTGVLSPKMMKELYPIIKTVQANLEKDVLVGSQVQKLNELELKQTKGFFGSEKQEVKDLGTGLGINATYYIPSTGEKLTYADLKEKFDEKSAVAIEGKYLPTNPFVKLTGDKDFANARQLSIDGVEIVVSGPKKFIDTKTGARTAQDYELQKNREINKIYNAKFTPTLPVEEEIYGHKVKLMYVPNKENQDIGTYYILDNKGRAISAGNSAEEIEDFAINNLELINEVNKQ